MVNKTPHTSLVVPLSLLAVLVGFPAFSQDPSETQKFSQHRDNYVVSGFTKEAEIEFQLSVKYRLFSVNRLYFGFTQRSFWDLWRFEESAPFRESNYAPEVFYEFCVGEGPSITRTVGVGLQHESNGKEGAISRSWNKIYIEPQLLLLNSAILIRPKLWVPFAIGDENADIRSYLGYGELRMDWVFREKEELLRFYVLLKKGASGGFKKSGVRLVLVGKPIRLITHKLEAVNPSLQLQHWNGYGESLESYDRPTKNFRVGITFVL